jgi:hypothetical protein
VIQGKPSLTQKGTTMRSFTVTFSTDQRSVTDDAVRNALYRLARDNGVDVSDLQVRSEVPATVTITAAEYERLINRA